MKKINFFKRKIVLFLCGILACSFSCYTKKDYVTIDSISVKHYDSDIVEILKKNIGFENKFFEELPVYHIIGVSAPKLENCMLDSAGFVQEMQESYVFVSCMEDGERKSYFSIVNENDFFRVGVFENIEKYISHPYVSLSLVFFIIVVLAIIGILRKSSFNAVFKISVGVSIYVVLVQFLLYVFPNCGFVTVLCLFQLPVNLMLYPMELAAKYPTWYSVLQFLSLQGMYLGVSFFFSHIKTKIQGTAGDHVTT